MLNSIKLLDRRRVKPDDKNTELAIGSLPTWPTHRSNVYRRQIDARLLVRVHGALTLLTGTGRAENDTDEDERQRVDSDNKITSLAHDDGSLLTRPTRGRTVTVDKNMCRFCVHM